MNEKKNLILIGFMGAGKTTVGRLLAREREYAFVDTDERIGREQGREIPKIFEQEGEEYFRDLETRLLECMQTDTQKSVISVGGGMPVRSRNRELLRSLGCVIYLQASKETILSRVRDDGSRPMLSGMDLDARVSELMRARGAFYHQAAHLEICTDKCSVSQVLQIIEQELSRFRFFKI